MDVRKINRAGKGKQMIERRVLIAYRWAEDFVECVSADMFCRAIAVFGIIKKVLPPL